MTTDGTEREQQQERAESGAAVLTKSISFATLAGEKGGVWGRILDLIKNQVKLLSCQNQVN